MVFKKYIIVLSAFIFTLGVSVSPSFAWTTPNATFDHSTGVYSFNYSSYSGGTKIAVSARNNNAATLYNWYQNSPLCTGSSSGFCAGTLSPGSGTPTCSDSLVWDIFDGSTETFTSSYTLKDIDNSCNDFTASNVSYNHYTGAYSINYSGYGGGTKQAVSFRNNRIADKFNWYENSPSCSGTSSGSCSGTAAQGGGTQSCSDYVVVDIFDGTNEYMSQQFQIAQIDSSCASFYVENVSFNHTTGDFSFDYYGYNGGSIIAASYRNNPPATSWNWYQNNPVCSSNHCEGTLGAGSGTPSCSDPMVVDIFDGSTEYFSPSINVADVDATCP